VPRAQEPVAVGVGDHVAVFSFGNVEMPNKKDETSPSKPPKTKVGDIIDERYKVTEILGQGGFATIFGAIRLEDGLEVVVKALHNLAVKNDSVAMERFKREARIAVSLDHPNIVHTLGFGRMEGDQLYLAMERLRGPSLEDILNRGPMDPAEVGRLLSQLLKALAAAHREGIIHRDLKPTNILYIEEALQPTLKVIDFGLAKVIEGTDPALLQTLTATGTIVGTPGYLAPEVLHGSEVTTQADIYAAGIIGHELCLGEIAYKGGALERVHAQAKRNPTPPSSERVRNHPVYKIIERLMAREPERRYKDATVAAMELDRVGDVRLKARKPWWRVWS